MENEKPAKVIIEKIISGQRPPLKIKTVEDRGRLGVPVGDRPARVDCLNIFRSVAQMVRAFPW